MSYKNIAEIIAAADLLSDNNVPCCAIEEGHWLATRAAMCAHMGRNLTEAETVCLSLSRAFGPGSSLLSEEETQVLVKHLWPEGNSGAWMQWKDLAEGLRKIRCIIYNPNLYAGQKHADEIVALHGDARWAEFDALVQASLSPYARRALGEVRVL